MLFWLGHVCGHLDTPAGVLPSGWSLGGAIQAAIVQLRERQTEDGWVVAVSVFRLCLELHARVSAPVRQVDAVSVSNSAMGAKG